MQGLLGCLKELATFHEKTIAQVALNWCIAKGTLPIPGAKTLNQVDQNLGALGWSLSEADVIALDQAAKSVDRKMIQNIFQTR